MAPSCNENITYEIQLMEENHNTRKCDQQSVTTTQKTTTNSHLLESLDVFGGSLWVT